MYRNQNLDLQPKILQACRKIFQEAAVVLYGENRFLYLLRDGTNEVCDIMAVARNDDPFPASDVEEPSEAGPTTRNRRGRRNGAVSTLSNYDINLDRYIKYMRHLSIEAEHNRFTGEAERLAVNAIKVFTDRYTWCPLAPGLSTRIEALEIRVVPTWDHNLDSPLEEWIGGFTFLDWFSGDSDLVKAVRAVSCDKLTVRLLSPPAAGARGRSRRLRGAATEEQGPCFTYHLDMYDLQATRLVSEYGIPDPWAADAAMQQGREVRVKEMDNEFAELRSVLKKACKDPQYGERGFATAPDDDTALGGTGQEQTQAIYGGGNVLGAGIQFGGVADAQDEEGADMEGQVEEELPAEADDETDEDYVD